MKKRVLCMAVGLLALSTASATVAVAQSPQPTNHAEVASSIIADPKFKAATAVFDRDHEKIVSELIEITEIPSPPFKEKVRAEAYRKKLADLGLSNVEIDEEGNVLAIRKGTASDGKFVAVIAHLDTVFPEGTEVKVRREGTKLMAPGIGDDAKGLTVVLAYLRAMDEAKIQTKDDILIVGSVGEEGLGDLRGVKHLFQKGKYKDKIKSALIVDGGDMETVTNGATGSKRYLVTFRGPGGHSYGAFGLVNPAFAMGEAMAQFSRTQVPSNPKTTYSIGVIGGGTSVNSIPNELWMQVDMRSVSVEELAKLEKRFLEIVDRAVDTENNARSTKEGPITVTKELVGDRPAGKTDESNDIVQAVSAVLKAYEYKPKYNTSSTDSNVPMSLGIPAVTVGRGAAGKSDRSHSLDEWVDVEKGPDVKALTAGLAMLLSVSGMTDSSL
ncbi:M20/M25/M40 family metallo-hydrolase [Microvirga lotononidis]|uniref:Di-/tripeptidase n=1 Tax=Microvirga lotononidis TaxID=864069 RepID=I4Z2F5_9HYPH|nr:M20/M25/M40 family metallo-hydrolase [Microvirga lotononidis]EIM30397.1 di-/tripeptidase [Microvirga lotononidis]WQO30897.1 M20/M25/M40 family metallo-hydrolase [Microvirga lotononidis]